MAKLQQNTASNFKELLVPLLEMNVITNEESSSISLGVNEIEDGDILVIEGFFEEVKTYFSNTWNSELQDRKLEEEGTRHDANSGYSNFSEFDGAYFLEDADSLTIIEPEWYLAITSDFVKATSKLDKKLQGRIFAAINKILSAPLESISNTIKPLTGNLQGFWRYRIGDYRIIYKPDLKSKHVYLLTCAARANVYD